MSNISSNCLFHFTSSAENLIGILTNEFHPRYSWERAVLNVNSNKGTLECAIPMICFCDISLGQIKDHIKTYGSYGIGMTKEWGRKNKLNPVIYINDNSNIAIALSKMAEQGITSEDIGKVGFAFLVEFVNISVYIKPYIGDFKRNDKLIKNVKFYDEREWRYVPQLVDVGTKLVLSKAEYDNPVILAQQNSIIKKQNLSFDPEDIKYIFVKDSKEILAMIKALKSIKGQKYDSDTIEILTSRILTTEQILNDF